MAATVTSRKIKLQFNVTPSATSTSSKRTWTFNYLTDDPQTTDIQALATAMVTNGSIFDTPPLSIIKAEIEETSTEQVIPAA